MAVVDQFIKKSKSRSSVVSKFIKAAPKQPVSQNQKLSQIAAKAGMEQQAQKILTPKPRLSVLQRLGAGLGAFETANAVATGIENKSFGAGVKQYTKDIGHGISSAFTGHDRGQTEKKHYSDILKKVNPNSNALPDKVLRAAGGFLGDVALDPSTYLSSSVAKGITKATKVAGKTGLGALGKVAPKAEEGLRTVGGGLKKALGKGFVFGHGTSKGLPEKALEITDQISKAKEGIVKSNVKRLGTGVLARSQEEELVSKLLAGKRAEFGGRSASEATKLASSTDPLVQKTIESQIGRSQKFAKSAGIEDPYAVYFPGIAKDKPQRFLEGIKSLRVGSQGYKKEFKDLLKDEELIRNPAEAFAKREFEIAKDNIVRTQLNGLVKQFGKPLSAFKTEDEALRAGYQVVKEKGSFGKTIGYLANTDKKFIDNLISPEFSTIDAIAKYTGFDALTSLFKRSVTGLFAPFHVRNYVSGLIQNYEVLGPKALSPKNIATGQRIAYSLARGDKLTDTIEIGTKSIPLHKVIKPFEKRFGTSSQYIADIADATKDTSKLIPTIGQKLNPLSAENPAFRTARAIGNFIETQQKATAYITALRNGKTLKQALDYAARAGFDYRALTPLESKVLRRIIPFYSFTRKNIELQLRTLGENPQRISNVIKLVNNLSTDFTPEERQQLPDYAKEQFGIKTGTSPSNLPEIAVGLGTPVEQVGQLIGKNPVRRIAAMLNPAFKLPLERAFNKDFFRDRPLTDVVEAGEYARAPEFVKTFLQAKAIEKKDKDGKVRTVYNANPYRLQLLRNLPTTRGATYVSAIFDSGTTTSKLLNAFTGIKPRPIDLETVEYFRNRDRQRELEDLLIKSGALKRFETTYVPKQ